MAKKDYNKNPLVLPPIDGATIPTITRGGTTEPITPSPLQIPLSPQRQAQILPPTVFRSTALTFPAGETLDIPMSAERASRLTVPNVGDYVTKTFPTDEAANPALIPHEPNALVNTPPNVGETMAKRQLELLAERESLLKPVAEDEKNSRFHSGWKAALSKGLEAFQPQYGVLGNWSDVISRLGAIPGAFVGGMVNDKWDENEAKQQGLAKNQAEQKNLDDLQDSYTKRQLNQAQIKSLNDKPEEAQKNRDAKAQTEQNKITERAEAAEKRNYITAYNRLPQYDENDPDDRAFGDEFQKSLGYRPLSKNAKTKSTQIVDQRDGQLYLEQTDEQGGNKLIRLTNDDGTPFKIQSNQMLASGDKVEQRKLQEKLQNGKNITALKVAEIGANSRANVANINQEGAKNRQQISVEATQKLAEYKTLVDRENKETDFTRKQQLQEQRIQAGRDLATLRDQLKDNK